MATCLWCGEGGVCPICAGKGREPRPKSCLTFGDIVIRLIPEKGLSFDEVVATGKKVDPTFNYHDISAMQCDHVENFLKLAALAHGLGLDEHERHMLYLGAGHITTDMQFQATDYLYKRLIDPRRKVTT